MAEKKEPEMHPVYAQAKAGLYLDTKDLAVLARSALKRHWPKVKFSVRISRYSMGSSLYVRWQDGPMFEDVRKLLGPLDVAGFDGMIDMTYDRWFWLNPDGSFSYAGTEGTQGSIGVIPAIEVEKPTPDAVRPKVVRCSLGLSRSMSPTARRTLSEFVLGYCRPVMRCSASGKTPLSEDEIKAVQLDAEGRIPNSLLWDTHPYPEHLVQVVRELFSGTRRIDGAPTVFSS